MTTNANEKREVGQEANAHLQDVCARDEVGNFGGGTSNFRGEWSRINKTGDVKDECEEGIQVHEQRQRSQGSLVNWERFLHIRTIKVLLVENDDSTRHIVAALLRNLNYEVIVAANGLQAWRILEDLSNHIDIVLTEVVMPYLSGLGLLCKITSHEIRKNIPVIMMSSHDSMSLVFTCLSKGAVDFLGKPIRKNELKNLWQHIWRRCHSSSGSGSESGTYTQKSVKSKSCLKSEENRSSKNEDNDMSTDLETDGTDEDSDSQSSWTKEVDSSQAMSARDQIAKSSDSTCAQLCSNAETCTKRLAHESSHEVYEENHEQIDNARRRKDLAIGKSKMVEFQLNNPNKVPSKLPDTNKKSCSKLDSYANKTRRVKDLANHSEHPYNKDKAIITNTPSPQMVSEDHCKTRKIKNKAFDNPKAEPEMELNLKRPRVAKDTGKAIQTDHYVSRDSDLSAISRYNTTLDGFKTRDMINISGSQETVKDKSEIRLCSDGNLLCLGVKNNVDMGSITNKLSINPAVVSRNKVTTSDKLEATSVINDLNLSSVFAQTGMDLNCPPPQVILLKTDDLASPALLTPIRGSPRELPVQHIHHHHHVHHFHNMDREQLPSKIEDLSYKKLTEESAQFRSLNVFNGPVEGNTGNCSLNKSGSGSKHGSNGQNGSSTIVHAGGTNVESDVHIAGKGGSGDASESDSGKKIEQNRSEHKEASLTKFRQKKERRLGNKARYVSKKRLAE
ncbi:Two-component response regulator-like APRR7 [Heracleum sosnowskyi]|uniref:Two-component response regulator-like APRR7 n=1 Tax=Heracleum sosnowskyi TaxID=360622 RepID=A0AAD8JGQ9_9APIA|nr:Two-component response regulator-like APRR7 [Heracleum sosnowskyi]